MRWTVLLSIALQLLLCIGCASSTGKSYTERIPGTAVEFDMVWVEAGSFWIGRTEVTWDEYLLYCGFDQELPSGVAGVSRPSEPLETHPYDRNWGTGTRPAVGMSKSAAEGYCAWLSEQVDGTYALPTEDEWLLAAGAPPKDLVSAAWVRENSDGMTHAVGLLEPNPIGLHDVWGNLWEYCAGGFSEDEPDRAVLRGGSWADRAESITPESRLGFDDFWNFADPNVPPGVWWVPEGDHLGFRLIRRGESD